MKKSCSWELKGGERVEVKQCVTMKRSLGADGQRVLHCKPKKRREKKGKEHHTERNKKKGRGVCVVLTEEPHEVLLSKKKQIGRGVIVVGARSASAPRAIRCN